MSGPSGGLAADEIAAYARGYAAASDAAIDVAFYCLMDSLACGLRALGHRECARILGPVVPGATMTFGARVPGTSFELDPVQTAFNVGAMVRWLDANDASFASQCGHAADNLGGILAVMDFQSRKVAVEGQRALLMRDLLAALIRAHEIRSVLEPAERAAAGGPDRALPVPVATAALVTALLGGSQEQVIEAITSAWVDIEAATAVERRRCAHLGWAAGDAASRGVRHGLLAMRSSAGDRAVRDPAAPVPQVRFHDSSDGLAARVGDAAPRLVRQFEASTAAHFPAPQAGKIRALFADRAGFEALPVHEFVALLVRA